MDPIILDQPNIVFTGPVEVGQRIIVRSHSITITGIEFKNINDDGDMIQCIGKECHDILIRNCRFIRESAEYCMDEGLSVVHGATRVTIEGCYFYNIEKAFLVGCGDAEWKEAEKDAEVTIKDTTFDHCGRRMPFIRYGKATLEGCVLQYWGGDEKNYKSYGIRAAEGAQVWLRSCSFDQKWMIGGLWHCILDNLRGGGFRKGVITESGGEIVEKTDIRKNHHWIKV